MRLLSAIFSLTVVAYAQTPSVTSASPATANAGGSSFSLTVTGSGFVTGSVVRWSGTPLATTYLGETSLTAAVPANLIAICGRFPLSVLNPGGTTSNTTVSVIVNPVLNGIAPNVVPAGSSGFDVTAFGQGFSSNVVITLNASGGKSNLPTNYSSSSALSAFIPTSALTGVYPVSVQVTDNSTGATTQALPITLTYAQVTQIVPEKVNAGDPDFTLSVGGSNFVGGAQVLWAGTPLVTRYINAGFLQATVPATIYANPAGGQVGISVKNPGAAPTNSVTMIVNPDPRGTTLVSLDPPAAVTGGPAFTLSAIGSRFATNSSIVWNTSPLPTTFVDSTKLTAVIPADLIGVDGSAAVSIQTPGITSSAIVRLPIVTSFPTVSSISPTNVPMGSAQVTLTVTGNGFIPASKVVALPQLPLTTTYVSLTQLTATVPVSALTDAGAYEIRVTNPGGSISPLPFIFTVKAPTPVLTKLTPAAAAAGGPDFTLAVTGSAFSSKATVNWNGSPLATTFLSASQLTALVPASLVATAGTANVTVANEGPAVSGALSFAITGSGPSIGSLNPSSAAAGGPAFTLTITGTGFSTNSKVQWNSTTLATTFKSDTQLTAAVPANLIASVTKASITVAGDGGTSNAIDFSVSTVTPGISTGGIVNAASSTPGIAPGALISIYGKNLATGDASAGGIPLGTSLGGTSVLVNGSAIPLLFVSTGQINAQLPYEIKPGTAKMVVQVGSTPSASLDFDVAATAPGLFVLPQSTHVVAQNLPDYTLNGAKLPQAPGQYCTLYVTGQGAVKPTVATGDGAPGDPLSFPLAAVQVKIGGQLADVQFAGLAPTFVGLMQINVKIPDVPAGDQPIELTVGGATAAPTVISVGTK
jgi:uncharacterized protein (TIGR03437 family)